MFRRIKSELREGRTLLQFGMLSALGQGLGMLAPLIVAKFLLPAQFASFSLARMAIFFFMALLFSSSQGPFVVFGNQERARTGRIAGTFTVQCVWLAAAIVFFLVAATLFAPWIMRYADITSAQLACVKIAFVALALKIFLGSLAMALGQRVRNSLQELCWGGATLACVVALYSLGRLTIETVFLVYVVALIPVVLVSLGSLRDPSLRPWTLDRELHRQMLHFTAWVGLGSLATFVVGWGDNLVLRPQVPMDQIGVYNLASGIFKGVTTLLAVIGNYFLPFVSEHVTNPLKMREYLFRKRPRVFLAAFAALLAFFLASPWLLRLVYGRTYEGAETVLLVLLIPSAAMLYLTFYIPLVNALKDYRYNTGVNVAMAAGSLLANLLLVPRLGILGAALAASVVYIASAAAFEVRYRTKLKAQLGL